MSSSANPFEEERELGFEKFYPMTLGEVINEKYKVVAKLGFGSASTIWCCRNLATNKYVALKIYAHDLVAEDEIDNETAMYKRLGTVEDSNHPGKAYVRSIEDSFSITSRTGHHHQCLVHEDIEPSAYSPRSIPDIKEENIFLGLADSSILEQLDTKEIAALSFYKSVNGYNFYRSANFGIPKRFGRPILCDFSLARNGQVEHCHDIQPDPYRAPEVILEMPWGYAVDIWNVGVMVWDMFENRHMFNGLDPESGKYGNRFHLASMVGLLGPPPWSSSNGARGVPFTSTTEYLNPVLPVSWEVAERNLEGSSKKGFLDFVHKMVRWTPESRATPSELLEDPWLLGEVEE
ncbi:CMGC/SRPK protein kinase [Blastomyces percursus]|uniref:CMGC/SRPK protein kinase n=1 Tax=Blastomyces percursus TaxID=1658174 RepID=A0A1J9QRV8_9EURO|nr:CMGC/SRPK protein kinase [Blastomyces percursus]